MSTLVGLCSTYKEGSLAGGAVRSLLAACDHVAVFEGPAGDTIDADVPGTHGLPQSDRIYWHEGRWRTDARKRQAMLDWTRQFEPPVWGIIVDADEVLINGEYMRDWLNPLDWNEELDPDAEYLGRPMRIMELNGQLRWVRGRILRLDRIVEYKVSTSVFTVRTNNGIQTFTNAGNVDDEYEVWEAPRRGIIEKGGMLVMPPVPTEPYLVHRSFLRHPLRRNVRMSDQEKAELLAHGMPVELSK